MLALTYRLVPGHKNWEIESAVWNLAGFFNFFRNPLAAIWAIS